MLNRISWIILGILVEAIGVAFAIRRFREPESTPALRGQALARKLGCFSCHGMEGRGGVADPGARSGPVPGWDGPTVATDARNEAGVVKWILHAKPRRGSRRWKPA